MLKIQLYSDKSYNEKELKKVITNILIKPILVIIIFSGLTLLSSCFCLGFPRYGGHGGYGGHHEHHDHFEHHE